MRKFICLLLACVTLLSMAACDNNSDTEDTTKPNTNVTANDVTSDINTPDTPDTTNEPDDKPTTSDEPSKDELLAQQKEECSNALSDIKISVLSSSVVPYDEAQINGYGAYSEDYDKATVLTLGLELPDEAYGKYWKDFECIGNAMQDENGKERPHTFSSAGWVSDDSNYLLIVYRIGGEVNVADLQVQLTGNVEDVVVVKDFANDAQSVGFESAKEAFTLDENKDFGAGSSVVKLKGRHYIIIRCYQSASSVTGSNDKHWSTSTQSFVLLPLEGGFGQSLTIDDVKLVLENEVAHTEGILQVNTSGRVDASVFKTQTTVEITAKREYVEPMNEDGYWDKEVSDAVTKDKQALINGAHVEIDDGDGNIVKLYFKR